MVKSLVKYPTHVRLAWGVTTAVAIRLILALLGSLDSLLWRPEVTTPANSLLQIREGVRLLQLSVSAYSGSGCHIPPLVLSLWAPWVSGIWYIVPATVCDLLGAAVVRQIAAAAYGQHTDPEGPWLSPGQLAVMYLWNPFAILSGVAGTSSGLENLLLLVGVLGGVKGNVPLASFGIAAGAYVGLHPLLLMVPVLQLLAVGPEDTSKGCSTILAEQARLDAMPAPSQHSGNEVAGQQQQQKTIGTRILSLQSSVAQVLSTIRRWQQSLRRARHGQPKAVLQQQAEKVQPDGSKQPPKRHPASSGEPPCRSIAAPSWQLAVSFMAHIKLWCWCLILLSDLALRDHPEQQCWPRIGAWVKGGWLRGSAVGGIGPGLYGYFHDVLGGCWMGQTYGFLMDVTDLTPNLGLFWYFFSEMFDAFRPFFKFVFHAFVAVFSVPMALRFPSRPLLLVFCQLLVIAMFKPHPSIADFVPWMSLLPLLQQQLQLMRIKLFLINSFVLLLVLAPSMWHQWINLDAANANFFYSITLLLGVWYTLFLGHMIQLSARVEWALCPTGDAGKQLPEMRKG